MIMPMPMPNDSASTMRAMAKSAPRATPVYESARILPAGAKNRKVMAGPSPAPFLWMPANSGWMVHEQTASRLPAPAAAG